MQKLKKSIKNNLLKSYLKDSSFVLTDTSLKNVMLKAEDSRISKNLTKSTINQLGLVNVLDSSVLKFPIKLEIFKTLSDLKICLNQEKEQFKKSPPILVKTNNLLLKDNNYELLVYQNPQNQFLKLKKSICGVINLVLLLKFKLNILYNTSEKR